MKVDEKKIESTSGYLNKPVDSIANTPQVYPSFITSVSSTVPNLEDYYCTTSNNRNAKSIAKKKITLKNLTAVIASDLFIEFCNEHGDLLTNLRLQRYLYFAQGWHLGLYKKPFFPDPIEAWPSGPVVPAVYKKYDVFGSRPIEQENSIWSASRNINKHIKEIIEVYAGFSSFDLQQIACGELPWKDARVGMDFDEPSSNEIEIASLKNYYEFKIASQEQEEDPGS